MKTFLRIQNSLENADFAILPIPYENNVSWGTGASNGPKAIIDASDELEFFSTYLNSQIADKIKIHTTNYLKVKGKSPEKMVKIVEEKVDLILNKNKKFAVLGGDHSVSIGIFNAIAKKEKEFSILSIDAHADLRETYSGNKYGDSEQKYNHACVMKRALEKTKDIVWIGVRSYSKEEAELIKRKKLKVFGTTFNNNEILKNLKKKVYITVDLDGFDPSEAPGVGTPQPGGLRWLQIFNLLKEISKKKEIIGFDIVELSPRKNCKITDFLAAKLLYNMVGFCFIHKLR